jgi:hypothetical protein
VCRTNVGLTKRVFFLHECRFDGSQAEPINRLQRKPTSHPKSKSREAEAVADDDDEDDKHVKYVLE